MKIEFTRAEVERILLDYANINVRGAYFNTVETTGYRAMPDGFVVSTKKEEDAAQ